MSDQQKTGAVTSLEEVFLSREFGRAPSRRISSIGVMPELTAPPQLEQVFLSEEFGRPATVPALAGDRRGPALALPCPAGSASERDSARYRAIAAVSGVAAAALVVVGVASGSGQPTKQPTVSAQGPGVGSNPSAPSGGSPARRHAIVRPFGRGSARWPHPGAGLPWRSSPLLPRRRARR